MRTELSNEQIKRMVHFVSNELSKVIIDTPNAKTKEVPFTSNQIVPAIKQIVDKINQRGLYVRGEGVQPVKSIFRADMEFKPDVSIGFGNRLYIAFEVKILRAGDASGSFSKAIGQGISYLALGDYVASFVLFFDTRQRRPLRNSQVIEKLENQLENLYILVW